MQELWKEIKNWEKYYLISSFGRIKILEREIVDIKNNKRRIRIFKEKFSYGTLSKNGYLYFTLKHKEKRERKFIHRLVLETFYPIENKKLIINHKDGNKTNNNISNLEWCTNSYNTNHAIRKGLSTPHTKKVTFEKALEIRNEYKLFKISQKILGIKHNLTRTQINRIINNKCWTDYENLHTS